MKKIISLCFTSLLSLLCFNSNIFSMEVNDNIEVNNGMEIDNDIKATVDKNNRFECFACGENRCLLTIDSIFDDCNLRMPMKDGQPIEDLPHRYLCFKCDAALYSTGSKIESYKLFDILKSCPFCKLSMDKNSDERKKAAENIRDLLNLNIDRRIKALVLRIAKFHDGKKVTDFFTRLCQVSPKVNHLFELYFFPQEAVNHIFKNSYKGPFKVINEFDEIKNPRCQICQRYEYEVPLNLKSKSICYNSKCPVRMCKRCFLEAKKHGDFCTLCEKYVEITNQNGTKSYETYGYYLKGSTKNSNKPLKVVPEDFEI